ncbi:MAG: UvrD-helicase domain-containing protein, partial [Nitrospirales bacterium]
MSHGTLPTIPDAGDRRLAETTFDRNVVVVAGAGTGKTTLLVNRLIHTLMREPSPVEITRLVALTFTNKAATEMKGRLRDRLLLLQDATGEAGDTTGLGAELLAELRARYGLSADKIGERARAVLHDLEKAQIGTLHSFAAHILRLYPIESGVDPDFREDDGLRFEEHFTTQWDVWLDAELGRSGHNHARWRRVLAKIGLGSIRDLAQALTSELINLEDLLRHLDDPHVPAGLRTWFQDKRERAAALLAPHDRPKRRSVEKILAAAQDLFAILAEPGSGGDGRIRLDAAIREDLARKLGSPPAGWADDEFAEAGAIARLARQSVDVDHGFLGEVLALVVPFVAGVRTAFLQEGWMTFDGLLARARLLLRDHPGVRERLKHEYQALLVDEFQDTDPVQYEIILYLAERAGRGERSWQGLDLAPGKLFIVGDPKQSIYAFRRADIEAFERVVAKIQESGGVQFTLTANFRSHPAVLSVVNPVFDRLLRPVAHVQPRNVPLVPLPDRRGGAATPGVELHLVSSADEEAFDAATATRCEAERLARWIKEDLLGRETLTDADGQTMPLRPGHIALLFRKLTIAQEYLDALRRNNVPYVTDGEKHFYRRQEVVDLINVLRVVDNPHDTIALVGVLRSPLGGLADQE